MKSLRTPGVVLATVAVIYTAIALLASVDGPLHADRGGGVQPTNAGHGGHLAQTAPTASITGNMNFCVDMAGALFSGPNYPVTVNGVGEDVDCAVMLGLYNDTVMLTWTDAASMAVGAGNAFNFTTACPAMDTPSTVDLMYQDDGVHNGGPGIQELAAPAMDGNLMYTILVPTGAMSGAAMVGACTDPMYPIGALSTFTTTVDPRPECAVCWSGILIGEPLSGIMGFNSTCEYPNMAEQIETGNSGGVAMGGLHSLDDQTSVCAAADIAFAANCMVTFTIQWEWGCAADAMNQITDPKPLQLFSYTWTGTMGNAMTVPIGGISSYVFARTP